jgi:hypothetical protein
LNELQTIGEMRKRFLFFAGLVHWKVNHANAIVFLILPCFARSGYLSAELAACKS